MVCRHAPGDPACSSHPSNRYRNDYATDYGATSVTPDAGKYSIEQVERVGPHLVLKVKYPNCVRCSYEGVKVLVFLDVSEWQGLLWKRIDPHFRAGKFRLDEAPSPAARFPASVEGWADALAYAATKARGTPRAG